MSSIPRLAFVLVLAVALVAAARPASLAPRACAGCCEHPSMTGPGQPAMPCCRITPDTQVPVARLTTGSSSVECAVLNRLTSPVVDAAAQTMFAAGSNARPPGAPQREILRI
jgi:hypothetical protein